MGRLDILIKSREMIYLAITYNMIMSNKENGLHISAPRYAKRAVELRIHVCIVAGKIPRNRTRKLTFIFHATSPWFPLFFYFIALLHDALRKITWEFH